MEFAAGKNFTQNAQFWVDSDVQAAEVAKAKRSRIAFNSDAYFNLLAMEPKVAQWLALGRNVQFVLNNTLYEICRKPKMEITRLILTACLLGFCINLLLRRLMNQNEFLRPPTGNRSQYIGDNRL